MLPCPDDITPIVPAGGTRSCRPSMTRIGLRALVTITRTNSSVSTWPNASCELLLAMPALTNRTSERRPERWSCSDAIASGVVMSSDSISIRPGWSSARSCSPVRAPPPLPRIASSVTPRTQPPPPLRGPPLPLRGGGLNPGTEAVSRREKPQLRSMAIAASSSALATAAACSSVIRPASSLSRNATRRFSMARTT